MRTPASLLALAALTAACGGKVVVDPTESPVPTCVEVCQASSTACGTDPSACPTSCAQLDKILPAACPDAYDAWLVCANDNPAVQCNNTTACAAETTALTDCLITACTTNPAACM